MAYDDAELMEGLTSVLKAEQRAEKTGTDKGRVN